MSGLLMSNPTRVRNALFRRSGLREEQLKEVFKRINKHTFCKGFDPHTKSLGIFFYPVTPGFADGSRGRGRAYSAGREYYAICKKEINKELKYQNLDLLKPLKVFGVVVVIKLYLEGDAADYFDQKKLMQFKEDYATYMTGGDCVNEQEQYINANIPKQCIEVILRTDSYFQCVNMRY
jgi:hypothetical protein